MALSFIGKPISLISHSDVRYRGILAGIDPVRSTIQLSNVYSMGTESRRPADQFIGPVQDPYAYIIFRASEVKDLAVDEPSNATPTPNVHDDPAVLGASAPAPRGAYPPGANGAPAPPAPGYPPQEQASPAPVPQQAAPANTQTPTPPPSRRPNNVHTANVSLETVERAMGELRVTGGGQQPQQYHQQHHPRGGRGRGGHRGGRAGEGGEQIKVPKTDFDFASSNARFEKAAPPKATPTNEDGSSSGEGAGSPGSDKQREEPAYNPKKSFFDSLSSSAQAAPPAGAREHGSGGHGGSGGGGGGGNGGYRGRRGGGGPGGMGGRNRREEEREKNVATFGEPGGVGLLGPGGYVGGWGGYGRRGGRPRRGAPGAGRGGSGVGGHAQYAQGGNGNGTQQ